MRTPSVALLLLSRPNLFGLLEFEELLDSKHEAVDLALHGINFLHQEGELILLASQHADEFPGGATGLGCYELGVSRRGKGRSRDGLARVLLVHVVKE